MPPKTNTIKLSGATPATRVKVCGNIKTNLLHTLIDLGYEPKQAEELVREGSVFMRVDNVFKGIKPGNELIITGVGTNSQYNIMCEKDKRSNELKELDIPDEVDRWHLIDLE